MPRAAKGCASERAGDDHRHRRRRRRGGPTRRRSGGQAVNVGFHPYDRPNVVFSLEDCQIADFRLMALWRELRRHLDLLPAKCTQLTLRLDREGRRHIIAESAGEPWLAATELRAALPDGEQVVCWW